MKHRKLRITWSVLCGIIGAALMLLLICSFGQHDALTTSMGDTIAESWRGRLGLNVPPLNAFNFHWQLVHESTADRVVRLDETQLPVNPPYFQFYRLAGRPGIVGPHMYFAFLFAFLAAAPYIHWRRSLRALVASLRAAIRELKNIQIRSGWTFAWQASCCFASILLIALWVRSYYVADRVCGTQSLKNTQAKLYFGIDYGFLGVTADPNFTAISKIRHCAVEHPIPNHKSYSQLTPYYARLTTGITELYIPIWILTVLVVLCGAVPSFADRVHYSLRALLVTTTLVATGLGLIMFLR
jgi:hypothetical protein